MNIASTACSTTRATSRVVFSKCPRYVRRVLETLRPNYDDRGASTIVRSVSSSSGGGGDRPPSLPVAEERLPDLPTDDDVADALRPHYAQRTPVILRGAVLRNGVACERWSDLDHLTSAVGEDATCDVEIGSAYNDPETLRPTGVPFGDYVEYVRLFEKQYGDDADAPTPPPPSETVYLAQNELFEGLRDEFRVPALCSDPSFGGLGRGVLDHVMFWFGPRGTVSPLHHDPSDNLLMQIVGRKKVILLPRTARVRGLNDPPYEEDWSYAGRDGQQPNTSPVDAEDPDLGRWPLFARAPPALEGVLYPGDALYVPVKWWHHVRSLDTSVSVNAWWL